MTCTSSFVFSEELRESVMLIAIKLVVDACAIVGVQTNQVSPLRLMSLAPAGAPAPRLKLNLSPLFVGGLIINRKVVFGAMMALVSRPGMLGATWLTVTWKDTLLVVLVG